MHMNIMSLQVQYFTLDQYKFTLKNTHILTSWYVVPVGSIDDVVVSEEVLVVAGPPVWVGHHLIKLDMNMSQRLSFRHFPEDVVRTGSDSRMSLT